MRYAKAALMNGVPYTLCAVEDMIEAEVDPYKNTFTTWESAEQWVANTIKEKKLYAIRRTKRSYEN